MPLCGNCFHELNTSDSCPLCGYDGTGTEKRHPQALRPGTILNGRYIVGRVLGQGGFGITYLALDNPTRERVAIKEYYPSELAGRGLDGCTVAIHSEEREENFAYGKAQFLEEARTLAAVSGSGSIVRIYSYFEENGTAYFAMEYVEGVSLDAYLREKGGRLTAPEAEKLFLPLMGALETVHKKGIVHRDIAPDNIIVTPEGKARLIDFGAARYSTGEKSRSLDVILKHGFAPYEQYMRRGRQGPWTDVYALAATFYYAVTGKVPPEAVERMQEDTLTKPSALGVNLGKGTEAVLLKALSVQAQERWQSMGEFSGALQAAAMAEAERKKGEPERNERKKREKSTVPVEKKKSPLPLILAAVAVLALVIFGATRLAKSHSSAVTAPPAETQAVETPEPTPVTVEENGLTFKVFADHAEVTNANKLLTYAEVPDAVEGKPVTGIGDRAFYCCRKLSSVTLPEGVTSIGDNAFFGCNRLNRITLPEGLTSIGNNAFEGCRYLSNITLPEGFTSIYLSSITLPEGLTSIGNSAFSGCISLEEITLPEGVTSIGDSAFSGCYGLTGITLPEGVTSIGNGVFSFCNNLQEIALPEGVTSIGDSAFSGCSSLREITLPEGVTSIGDKAFYSCDRLREITLPEGLTSIGREVFDGGITSRMNFRIHAPAGSYAAEFFKDDPRLVIDG